ncbi:MFS family permease [Thermocatellispora tengchongensis]|uniref:MFS family permease n=1 Tax=Thermocatellispora tengchongensis TaxID=1073253 RepID=A0A840PIS4_9ACTN|nr:MFS transporter [Thermocatellispora tengchongensis]MBB5137450.1 MFS family permease [Thermocatellispora tengchongensis]
MLVRATFAYNGLETVLAPAVPLIQKAVGASTPAIAWVFTGVLLAGAVATPVVGRLADIRDKRRILLWVLAIVGVGTIVAALAKSVLVLAIGQLLQGAGLGLILVGLDVREVPRSGGRVACGARRVRRRRSTHRNAAGGSSHAGEPVGAAGVRGLVRGRVRQLHHLRAGADTGPVAGQPDTGWAGRRH